MKTAVDELGAVYRTLVFNDRDVAPPLLPSSLSRRGTRFDFVVRPVVDGEPMEPSDDAGSAYEHKEVGIYGYVASSISKFGLCGLTEAFRV
ncbi:hypothetical protein Fmac_021664 [Flemingia macrophylla]|uniref:Uncharacterized protein n=1 Tax=Flemingia macrophylla TaxID=520843 RepID=A0ABD1LXH8_9FABA